MSIETTIALSARAWSATAAAAIESGTSAQLMCRVGGQVHAIPIGDVIEIMRALPVEPIAGTPAYVRGLCIIRGEPVPVVDSGLLIGGRETQPGRLVAIKAGQRMVALQVEAVLGVRLIDAGTFNELPPLLRDVAAETVAAIGTADAELLLILRAARIVPEALLDSLARQGANP
jgi:purine-binding chemotaxis protein CheW